MQTDTADALEDADKTLVDVTLEMKASELK